jgi:hypothetical protein
MLYVRFQDPSCGSNRPALDCGAQLALHCRDAESQSRNHDRSAGCGDPATVASCLPAMLTCRKGGQRIGPSTLRSGEL